MPSSDLETPGAHPDRLVITARRWRFIIGMMFLYILLFSTFALIRVQQMGRESAVFEAWLRRWTNYTIDRDAEWNARFERIDRREEERRVIFGRIVKLLDAIDARAKK